MNLEAAVAEALACQRKANWDLIGGNAVLKRTCQKATVLLREIHKSYPDCPQLELIKPCASGEILLRFDVGDDTLAVFVGKDGLWWCCSATLESGPTSAQEAVNALALLYQATGRQLDVKSVARQDES